MIHVCAAWNTAITVSLCVGGGGGMWEVEVGVGEVREGKYENLIMQIKP